jgi:hypothetical protein
MYGRVNQSVTRTPNLALTSEESRTAVCIESTNDCKSFQADLSNCQLKPMIYIVAHQVAKSSAIANRAGEVVYTQALQRTGGLCPLV